MKCIVIYLFHVSCQYTVCRHLYNEHSKVNVILQRHELLLEKWTWCVKIVERRAACETWLRCHIWWTLGVCPEWLVVRWLWILVTQAIWSGCVCGQVCISQTQSMITQQYWTHGCLIYLFGSNLSPLILGILCLIQYSYYIPKCWLNMYNVYIELNWRDTVSWVVLWFSPLTDGFWLSTDTRESSWTRQQTNYHQVTHGR